MTFDKADTEAVIRTKVRSGFYDVDEIEEQITEDYLDLDDLGDEDLAWISVCIEKYASEKREAEKSWPEITDWDRLDHAFDALLSNLIVALHNTGMTQSDGLEDVGEVIEIAREDDVDTLGWAFYHGQDTDRAIDDGVLMLSFGSCARTPNADKAIAALIVEQLKSVALNVHWSGDTEARIEVRDFNWLKRGMGEDDDDEFHDDGKER